MSRSDEVVRSSHRRLALMHEVLDDELEIERLRGCRPVNHERRTSNGADTTRRRRRLSLGASVWALGYATYRGYYAAGGTAGLPGTIAPGWEDESQRINLAATVIIGIAAVLPVAAMPLWVRPRARPALLALCWVVAVGCSMHAAVDIAQRVLSLAGVVDIHYPSMWASVDRRAADLQDLFGNEPWFLLLGVAYGALGWTAIDPGRRRTWWAASGIAAIVALTLVGLLAGTGVIGRAVVG